jgi:hypothetical protein
MANFLMIGSNMSCGTRSRFFGLCGGQASKARPGNFSRPSSQPVSAVSQTSSCG